MRKGNGLYNATYEHDACGVGMVVNIHGNKSHELVDNALKVLENMQHRGAETRDKTGDGAGILLQIPHEFILLQGIPVPEKGKYGTGLVFLPKDKQRQSEILSIMIEETERDGLSLMHLRNVPTNDDVPGVSARGVQPDIKQVFITGVKDSDVPVFDRILYKLRKRIENRIDDEDFYICSLSNKDIIYKGMLTSGQLRRFFPDLSNNYLTSGLALVHSLKKGWELSYGMKFQNSNNRSYQATTNKDGADIPDATSQVDIEERILSFYGGISKQINERISLEASVEAEQYHSPQWNKWYIYPTLNASWKANSGNILNLSFSSNSQFPNYWSTMSSIYYASTYMEIWGNPHLKPYSTYETDLMWTIKSRHTLMAFAEFQPNYSGPRRPYNKRLSRQGNSLYHILL